MDFALKHIHNTYPDAPIVGLGTSMGAGIILKYAAETGDECLLLGIAAAGTPFDYNVIRDRLNSWWPYLGYADQFIVSQIKERFFAVKSELVSMQDQLKEKGICLEEVANCQSSKEFDTKFTIKLYGYESPEKYYDEASVVHVLEKIKVPVLSLNSKDDPIVYAKCIPYEKLKERPNIILAVTELGGHISWYSGIKPKRWYQKPCLEFLDALLD